MAEHQDQTRLNDELVEAIDGAETLEAQRRFFRSGQTRPYDFRRKQLLTLRRLVEENEERLNEALAADLAKPRFEAYTSEVGFVLGEIRHALAHLEDWMEPERVSSPLVVFPSTSVVLREPFGIVLIIGPWNYPVQLMLAPLVGALAAGNCAFLKPSELAVETSGLLSELVAKYFPKELVSSATGGVETSKCLLKERFDHIFFTGSTAVGRIVAKAAAEHLTPTTLELGGKSPAIVDERVDLKLAAKRIVWGKFLNAGQSCIAPDYALVPHELREPFEEAVTESIRRFFGDDPSASPDFGRIVNDPHFERLRGYLSEGRVVTGGETDRTSRYIAPTVLDEVEPSARVLDEEIFGPILPVVPYETIEDAIEWTRRHPDPLALYVFSKNRDVQERVLTEVPFGGGAVNDTMLHFSNPELPFGGRGPSGMGRYHGRYSFEAFSHRKSTLRGSTLVDPFLRYPPYGGKLRWLKKLLG